MSRWFTSGILFFTGALQANSITVAWVTTMTSTTVLCRQEVFREHKSVHWVSSREIWKPFLSRRWRRRDAGGTARKGRYDDSAGFPIVLTQQGWKGHPLWVIGNLFRNRGILESADIQIKLQTINAFVLWSGGFFSFFLTAATEDNIKRRAFCWFLHNFCSMFVTIRGCY